MCCVGVISRCLTILGVPSSLGSISPTISLIMVDLPAPLTPITATREAIETCTLMLLRVLVSRVGYLNETSVILISALVREVTPSSMPGSGKEKAKASVSSL